MFERVRQFMGAVKRLSLDSDAGWSTVFKSTGNRRGLPSTARAAATNIPAHTCFRARVSQIRKVPIRISTANDTLVESGDLHALLSRPNLWQDWTQYVAQIEGYLSLYDMCLVAKVADDFGKTPDELIPLDPQRCIPQYGVHAPTGMRIVVGWLYVDVGGSHFFTWEDVIPMVGNNPYAPFHGLAPVVAAEQALAQDTATREQNLSLFTNGGMPDIVLETDKTIDAEQRAQILDGWNSRYRGVTNAHKTGILWGGLKANKLAFNPQEMQTFEGLRMTLKDAMMAFRVMPAMVMSMEGETGLSQGSSTDEQMVAWWNGEGLGELDRIATAHQRFLVDAYTWKGARGQRSENGRQRTEGGRRKTEDGGRDLSFAERSVLQRQRSRRAAAKATSSLYVWFDENAIEELVDHRRKRIEQFDRLANRGYAPDDLNDYFDLGLPPHPTNVGTIPFSLLAVTDLGALPNADRRLPNAEGGRGLEPRMDTDGHRSRTENCRLQATNLFNQVDLILGRAIVGAQQRASAEEFKSVWKAWSAFRKQWEKTAAKKHSRIFLDQRKRVLDRLNAVVDDTFENGDQEELFNVVFPLADEAVEVGKLLRPLVVNMFEAAYEQTAAELSIESPFNIDDPAIKPAVEQRVIVGSKINETTADDLRQILGTAFEEGYTQQELADSIADYYAQHIGETKARPMTAARTQTSGIVNDARLIGAQKAGGLKKAWFQGAANEPRLDHTAAMNHYLANPIELDAKFVVGGEEMSAPGDSSAPPSQTANCTCMVVFVKPET